MKALPLRLQSRASEPAHGVLARLAARHGEANAGAFAASIGINLRDVLAGRHAAEIAELAGLDGAEVERWLPRIEQGRIVRLMGEAIALGD